MKRTLRFLGISLPTLAATLLILLFGCSASTNDGYGVSPAAYSIEPGAPCWPFQGEWVGDGQFDFDDVDYHECDACDGEPLDSPESADLRLASQDPWAGHVRVLSDPIPIRGEGPFNRVTDAAAIENARKLNQEYGKLRQDNQGRIDDVLRNPTHMPANPLKITFERFKLAVHGDDMGRRVALHFKDVEQQNAMAKDFADAMATIDARVPGGIGDWELRIIGSGTSFFSNNPLKVVDGKPKLFGAAGSLAQVDMDLQLTCPKMAKMAADQKVALNDNVMMVLGQDDRGTIVVRNLFKNSGAGGAKGVHDLFPELKAVTDKWTTALGVKEVDAKLLVELKKLPKIPSGDGGAIVIGKKP